jgi:hypothetical protein
MRTIGHFIGGKNGSGDERTEMADASVDGPIFRFSTRGINYP